MPDARPPAIILAQGTSRRFGGPQVDKGLAILAGVPLVARVAERLAPQVARLAINGPASYEPQARALGAVLVDEGEWAGSGPLAGIRAGLAWAGTAAPVASHLLVAPVDMPFLPDDLVATLQRGLPAKEAAIACPEGGATTIPVLGLWPLAALAEVEAVLRAGGSLAVRGALDRVHWRAVPFAADVLADIDDEAALIAAELRLARAAKTGPPAL